MLLLFLHWRLGRRRGHRFHSFEGCLAMRTVFTPRDWPVRGSWLQGRACLRGVRKVGRRDRRMQERVGPPACLEGLQKHNVLEPGIRRVHAPDGCPVTVWYSAPRMWRAV